MSGLTLYHYCNTSTFCKIIESGSVLLSDMRLSNDHMEGKYIIDSFRDFAETHSGSSLRLDVAIECANLVCESVGALAFCLSKQGDKLSQWRGYADDAKGFSIGFSQQILDELISEKLKTGQLVEVRYTVQALDVPTCRAFQGFLDIIPQRKPSVAISEMKKLIELSRDAHVRDFFDESAYKMDGIKEAILGFAMCAFTYKNPAFNEEEEYRVIVPAIQSARQFHNRDDRIVPHVKLNISDIDGIIEKVYIGPKNVSRDRDVNNFLLANNVYCEVEYSKASYR